MDKKELKRGIITSIPLIIGYIPIAMAFGIVGKNIGLGLIETSCFSIFVFAGSSQFIAISLLAYNIGINEIILTTFLINFRHFLMSASLKNQFKDIKKRWFPFIAFGVTDEVFSVASLNKNLIKKEFLFPLQILAYLSWCIGTITGYILGNLLPVIITTALGISLYAMFTALLVGEVKKDFKIIKLITLSGLLNFLMIKQFEINQGWSIIISIIITSFYGIILFAEEEKNEQNSNTYYGDDCSNIPA